MGFDLIAENQKAKRNMVEKLNKAIKNMDEMVIRQIDKRPTQMTENY